MPLYGEGVVRFGGSPKSAAVYKDLFTLWKDADPDIPILNQAKAEFSKLQ